MFNADYCTLFKIELFLRIQTIYKKKNKNEIRLY